MIWLTWRQHRNEALIGIALLVLVIGLLIGSGLSIAANYQQAGYLLTRNPLCSVASITCPTFKVPLSIDVKLIGGNVSWLLSLLILPIGMFVGAPLLPREMEHGTNLLIWTQSISGRRWLTVKLSLLMLTTVLAFALLTIVTGWWSSLLNSLQPASWQTYYELQGTLPVVYALFILALGIAVGAIVRRTIPAMAITMAVFFLVRFSVALLLRPYFLPAMSYRWDFLQPDPRAAQGDWVVSTGAVNHTGHLVSSAALSQLCDASAPVKVISKTKDFVGQCLHDHGILPIAFYHPVSQFWLFQGIETAMFLTLSVTLVALTFWWFKHRIA